MKLRNPWLIRATAFLAAALIRAWMGTVRGRIDNRDATTHPADPDRHRFIYGIWHETLLAPVKFKTRAKVLISKHADGELIAQALGWLGFGVVRGSTNRGGGSAMVELWHCSDASHLVFTPDGPRGPRRTAKVGMVAMASHTGMPVVPVGIGYSRCWRAKSWDRLAVPRPFSKVFYVMGEAIHVPPDLDREGLERYRKIVEQRMLDATEAAEAQAAGGAPAPHFRPKSPSDKAATGSGRGPLRTS